MTFGELPRIVDGMTKDELKADLESAWGRLDKAEKDARKYRGDYDHVLGLIRSTKMYHGTCKPRERKACTACNAQEELDKILSGWKGGAIYPA